MSNLANLVEQLRTERDQAQERVDQLDRALEALTGLSGVGRTAVRRGRSSASGNRRTMSAAARKRIGTAQRARWAKVKAAARKRSK